MSELLQRIAEIEGWGADAGGFFWTPSGWWIDDVKDIPWSTCGPLIEKYELDCTHDGVTWGCAYWGDYSVIQECDPDLKTAIVKAVVAAHE